MVDIEMSVALLEGVREDTRYMELLAAHLAGVKGSQYALVLGKKPVIVNPKREQISLPDITNRALLYFAYLGLIIPKERETSGLVGVVVSNNQAELDGFRNTMDSYLEKSQGQIGVRWSIISSREGIISYN